MLFQARPPHSGDKLWFGARLGDQGMLTSAGNTSPYPVSLSGRLPQPHRLASCSTLSLHLVYSLFGTNPEAVATRGRPKVRWVTLSRKWTAYTDMLTCRFSTSLRGMS
jgi:hypothetical protein